MTKNEAWAEMVVLMDGDAAWLSRWMNRPQYWLEGATPRVAMDTEEGCEKVVARIGQIAYGVFV